MRTGQTPHTRYIVFCQILPISLRNEGVQCPCYGGGAGLGRRGEGGGGGGGEGGRGKRVDVHI